MEIKEHDVVRLIDGREGTVLETFDRGAAFMIELADASGRTLDTPIVKRADIKKVIYNA